MIEETDVRRVHRCRRVLAILPIVVCAVTLLAGCDVMAAPNPTPVPSPVPTASPTSEVTFQVAVTPIVRHPHHRATPTPIPTRFVAPNGPYIMLQPNTGPPVDRTITVVGANFPHNVSVTILWGLSARLTPLSTTGYSDGRGRMRVSLSVPASAPGLYRVLAEVQGVPYARATYDIVSLASLATSVTPTAGGGTLSISGKKFVPGFQLMLIAYPTVSGRKPVSLGTVQVNSRGRFSYSRPVDDLEPGQYILRAWSASSVAAEMAQTFFEVVV